MEREIKEIKDNEFMRSFHYERSFAGWINRRLS